jgi:transposase
VEYYPKNGRAGKIGKEAKVASDPEALVSFFAAPLIIVVKRRIGLEAGPLSQWLHAGQAGFETVLLETRHVKAALWQ